MAPPRLGLTTRANPRAATVEATTPETRPRATPTRPHMTRQRTVAPSAAIAYTQRYMMKRCSWMAGSVDGPEDFAVEPNRAGRHASDDRASQRRGAQILRGHRPEPAWRLGARSPEGGSRLRGRWVHCCSRRRTCGTVRLLDDPVRRGCGAGAQPGSRNGEHDDEQHEEYRSRGDGPRHQHQYERLRPEDPATEVDRSSQGRRRPEDHDEDERRHENAEDGIRASADEGRDPGGASPSDATTTTAPATARAGRRTTHGW